MAYNWIADIAWRLLPPQHEETMIRNHPLLLLFLVASVTVDVVLLKMGHPREFLNRALLSGLLFGQTAALAIWAVWGRGHRLARVSCMVVVTCVLAYATGGRTMLSNYQWLSVLCVYTLAVYLWSLLIAAGRAYTSKSDGVPSEGPSWQVSLIELFGWTILVAIASFAARSMEFTFLQTNSYIALKVFGLLAVPAFVASGVIKGLEGFTSSKWYWIVFVVALAPLGYLFRTLEPLTAVPMLLAQTGYLLTWLLVLRLDRAMRHRANDESQEAIPTNGESGQLDA